MNDLIERRSASRFNVRLPATLKTACGDICTGEVSNISLSGMQLVVCHEYMPLLLPNVRREYVVDTVHYEIVVDLPSPFRAVIIMGGVVYVNRRSMNQIAVGCRFEEFMNESANELGNFIMSLEAQNIASA
ncbi:PilZ domain-containing protein [Pleionea sp. CnH1-48]|uniref:PilZ domain-containing protein n=1 Tax=Pleionea sp. CnH1-48 TaxID=2954494 RepID=UPI002096A6C2|nr:PilZ domain-containing protein [Pleionea sp. CnH1-48]MCO7224793.1 PilZ domain-containing protein [Pleionea sp. CnH1-48]